VSLHVYSPRLWWVIFRSLNWINYRAVSTSETEVKDLTKLMDKIDQGIQIQNANEAESTKLNKFNQLTPKLLNALENAYAFNTSEEGSRFDGYVLHLAIHYHARSDREPSALDTNREATVDI